MQIHVVPEGKDDVIKNVQSIKRSLDFITTDRRFEPSEEDLIPSARITLDLNDNKGLELFLNHLR